MARSHGQSFVATQGRGARLTVALSVLVAALIVAGPASVAAQTDDSSAGPSASPLPLVDTVADDLFELSVTTPKTTQAVGEPIEVSATLAYVGTEPEIVVAGGLGLVGFGICGDETTLTASVTVEVVETSSPEASSSPPAEAVTTVEVGDWTVSCEGVPDADCRGVVRAFIGSMAAVQRLIHLRLGDGVLSVERRPNALARPTGWRQIDAGKSLRPSRTGPSAGSSHGRSPSSPRGSSGSARSVETG